MNREPLLLLIVDDDPQICDLLRLIFHDEGFETVVASDSIEALRVLDTMSVDVVILDLMLPDRSGIDLLPSLHGTPVLVLTALPRGHRLVRDAEQAGIEVMVKPFAPLELVAAVRRLVA